MGNINTEERETKTTNHESKLEEPKIVYTIQQNLTLNNKEKEV